MLITARTVGLATLSAFTAALTATSLLHSDVQGRHASPVQVAVVREAVAATPAPLPMRTPQPAAVIVPAARPPENPSALEVAGNPRRYVGAHVHWTCAVDLVPEPTFADANCGPDIPSFVQQPLTAGQMENDPDAVAQSIRLAQQSLHGSVRALLKRAMIVLTGPVENLDHGEIIVINGTVRRPLHGENAFGVTRAYPTVHIDSIEQSRSPY